MQPCGRKSKSKRFDGHEAPIAVDAESQLITAFEVLAGNAPDSERVLEPTEANEANGGLETEEIIGEYTYGDGITRQRYRDAGRKLVAQVAPRGNGEGL